MRLCFIVERVYRQDGMPLRVAEQLLDWGHEVDLLETALRIRSDNHHPSLQAHDTTRRRNQ